DEKSSLNHLTTAKSPGLVPEANVTEQAIVWAEEHLFERRSIVHEHELWRHALERARGQDVSLADLQAVTQQRDYLHFDEHPGKITTREQLEREMEIVQTVKEGIGGC